MPGERQFSDAMLMRVIEREGVIGVPIDTWMLYRPGVDWTRVTRQRPYGKTVTLDDYVDHVDHICQLARHSRCAAIGGETDCQAGSQGAPKEIDTVADFHRIGERLADRGYADHLEQLQDLPALPAHAGRLQHDPGQGPLRVRHQRSLLIRHQIREVVRGIHTDL